MNGVQTRFKCKLDVKRCKRFVFPPSSLLPRSNALKTKAIRYFQTDRTLTRIVSPPLLEIPLSTVEYAARKAYEKGVKVVLNPAPACSLPESLFQYLYMITPNRIEAEMLTGVKINSKEDVAMAAGVLYRKGVKNIIITLGSEGSFVREGEKTYYVDAYKVVPVDTTAAGDTFNGAVCVGVSEGMSLEQAVLFASKASSISVTRMGAQSSIPYRKELDMNNLV